VKSGGAVRKEVNVREPGFHRAFSVSGMKAHRYHENSFCFSPEPCPGFAEIELHGVDDAGEILENSGDKTAILRTSVLLFMKATGRT
jgi:hypothetical protein